MTQLRRRYGRQWEQLKRDWGTKMDRMTRQMRADMTEAWQVRNLLLKLHKLRSRSRNWSWKGSSTLSDQEHSLTAIHWWVVVCTLHQIYVRLSQCFCVWQCGIT